MLRRLKQGDDLVTISLLQALIPIALEKVSIKLPRIRNKLKDEKVVLSAYKKLQKPYEDGKEIFLRLLLGLSTHKYEECIKFLPQAFGLSASNLSSRFKKFAEQALKQLQTRRLNNYDFICI